MEMVKTNCPCDKVFKSSLHPADVCRYFCKIKIENQKEEKKDEI